MLSQRQSDFFPLMLETTADLSLLSMFCQWYLEDRDWEVE